MTSNYTLFPTYIVPCDVKLACNLKEKCLQTLLSTSLIELVRIIYEKYEGEDLMRS
jgi:hypothetical protein